MSSDDRILWFEKGLASAAESGKGPVLLQYRLTDDPKALVIYHDLDERHVKFPSSFSETQHHDRLGPFLYLRPSEYPLPLFNTDLEQVYQEVNAGLELEFGFGKNEYNPEEQRDPDGQLIAVIYELGFIPPVRDLAFKQFLKDVAAEHLG